MVEKIKARCFQNNITDKQLARYIKLSVIETEEEFKIKGAKDE